MREVEREVPNRRSFGRGGLNVFLFAAIDEHGWRSIEQPMETRLGFEGWNVLERQESMFGQNRVVWRLQSTTGFKGKFMQVLNGVVHCKEVPCVLQMNADHEPINFSEFGEWLGTVHTVPWS